MTQSSSSLDWFEKITGFREGTYDETRARLSIENGLLVSPFSQRRCGVGQLELASLNDLRVHRGATSGSVRRTTVRCLAADVRALHSDPEFSGALFQVASQFNLLEMVSPNVSPEDGVARYAHDRTQGPACAIAAGAATIYRNYFAPVGEGRGQTAVRQIDALAPMGEALSHQLNRPVHALWTMRNGYAICTLDGLRSIGELLRRSTEPTLDHLRGQLAIGLHWRVEVTDSEQPTRPTVSQAFCSALPVRYTHIPTAAWEPFARLVLEAAYEATLLAACKQRNEGGSRTVLLTRLGGGAFGNDDRWIDEAIDRALRLVEFEGLDVCLVSFGRVHAAFSAMDTAWNSGPAARQE